MLAIDQLPETFIAPSASWYPAPQPPALLNNEVHVWRVSLKVTPAQLQSLDQLLSPDERARTERFHFQKDQDQYIAARGLLRRILSRYLDVAPAQLRFSYSSYGKPALTNSLGEDLLNFNMSHSHGLAIVGLTRGRKIGVDLERIQTDFACEEIAERMFSP